MAQDFFGRQLRDDLPGPTDSPELFQGVLSRRVFGFLIDTILMGILVLVIWVVSGIMGLLTFGLAWLVIPVAVPLAPIAYYLVTLGLGARSTPGMRMMDVELAPTRSYALERWEALLHALLFWLSVSFLTPFVVLVGLFTDRRQLLHDLVVGTMVVRRSAASRRVTTVRAEILA